MNGVLLSVSTFTLLVMAMMFIVLVARRWLSPGGSAEITINGQRTVDVEIGSELLKDLSENGLYRFTSCFTFGSQFSFTFQDLERKRGNNFFAAD